MPSLFWRVLPTLLCVYPCDIDKLIVWDKRSILRGLKEDQFSKSVETIQTTSEYKEIDIAVSIFTDQMKKDLEYFRFGIRKNRKEYETILDRPCSKRCKREEIDPLLLSLLDKLEENVGVFRIYLASAGVKEGTISNQISDIKSVLKRHLRYLVEILIHNYVRKQKIVMMWERWPHC